MQINGLIKLFKLEGWWLTTFTKKEQDRLIETYGKKLIEGDIQYTSITRVSMLKNMCAFWQPNENDQVIITKIQSLLDDTSETFPAS